MPGQTAAVAIFLFAVCALGMAGLTVAMGYLFNPGRVNPVKRMPYESGMDPIHEARRRFDVRYHLLAIAFLVFDVELLFLYPWAVASRPLPLRGPGAAGFSAPAECAADATGANSAPGELSGAAVLGIDAAVARGPAAGFASSRHVVFAGAMVFLGLLVAGLVYDWRRGILRWR